MEEKISPKTELKKLIFTISLILIVFLIFILYLSWPLLTGKTIVLSTLPIDPFDVFRGQYITINYNISSIPVVLEGASVGDNVYVSLQKEGEIYEFKSVSLTKPEDLFIRGHIVAIYGDMMRVQYGIEQYFFERNAQFPMRNLQVKAKVDSSGKARIVQLLQNGKPLEIDYKNISFTS